VIKREDVIETDQSIQLTDRARAIDLGANIRRSGENLAAGEAVLERGAILTSANLAAAVNFGCVSPQVFGRVKVSVLTTGDEVIDGDQSPQPWQLRNSNLHALMTMFRQRRWIDVQSGRHCGDDRVELTQQLMRSLEQSDVVVLTGGVSMGDYDFVPDVVQEVGGQVVFHKLPIRPGKPILGAVTKDGKLIMGLPGNPVSAVVNARRMVLPLIAKISGQTHWLPRPVKVTVEGLNSKSLPLHQMVLVSITQHGHAKPVSSKGSGDLVALANSDGFVEIPANDTRDQPRKFLAW
jgi:molybdenum cofactor synthesis domain-containing protein